MQFKYFIGPKQWYFITIIFTFYHLINITNATIDTTIDESDTSGSSYTIEGKVYAPEIFSSSELNWQRDTKISINAGEYAGFLKDDGTFSISGMPSGSYVVEVTNPDYYYESVIFCVWQLKSKSTAFR